MNFMSLWQKTDLQERTAQRHGLSLVTTMRGERGKRGTILIRDLSDDGFKAECLVRFKKGSDVVVDLPGGRTVAGTIEWARNSRIGVSFKNRLVLGTLAGAISEG